MKISTLLQCIIHCKYGHYSIILLFKIILRKQRHVAKPNVKQIRRENKDTNKNRLVYTF